MSASPSPPRGTNHSYGTGPSRQRPLVGRTLRGGILVKEWLGVSPLGSLYCGEYASGVGVAVLALDATSADPVTLPLLELRFRRAIEIRHPNVAAVYEIGGTDDGLFYVLAESLTGELLSSVLAKRGALPLNEALDITLQAASGLQAAHQLHWAHGNISPETILLSHRDGGRPIVKLIGFTQDHPLLQHADGHLPAAEGLRPEYTSPERFTGQLPDERSDLFSLAAVLRHLVTGAPPSHTGNGAGVPEALRPAIERALAASPGDRFQTVAEFAAALERPESPPAPVPQPSRSRASRILTLGTGSAVIAASMGLWLLGSKQPQLANPPGREGLRETASAPGVASLPKSGSTRLRLVGPALVVRHDSTAARIPAPSGRRSSGRGGNPAAVAEPKISAFRRSHPWVAVQGERFYYRSSCSIALQPREWLYFESEKEARARGFVPSETPECR